MREVIVTNVGAINFEKLDADLRAAIGENFVGLTRRKDRTVLYLLFADKASDEEVSTAQNLVTTHDPTQKTDEQQLFETIKTTAQSAVGVALNDLTAGQQRALTAILLWRAGGVAKDGTVAPLKDWVR